MATIFPNPSIDPASFCTWLQGYVELTSGKHPTLEQWTSICQHLQLVFTKVTPVVGDTLPAPKPTRAPRPIVLPDDANYCGMGGSGRVCADDSALTRVYC